MMQVKEKSRIFARKITVLSRENRAIISKNNGILGQE